MADSGAALWRRFWVREGKFHHFREVILLVFAYFTYMLVRRYIVPGAAAIGTDNAVDIISLERDLGLFWEPWLQTTAADAGDRVLVVFNYLYILTFFPTIIPIAVVMYILNRERYLYYRGMILLSFAVAPVLFALFPLAPPRFMDLEGIVDTIAVHGPQWYAAREMDVYYNAYAAMPSLHFSWTFLFGMVSWNTGPRALKFLGAVYPTMTFFAIVITGNHYVIDAIGGVLMIGVVFLLYRYVIHARPREQAPRDDRLSTA